MLVYFHQAGFTDRTWIGMGVLSLVFHALFLWGVVFLPQLRFTPPRIPSAVEVDLVSLPPGVPRPEAPRSQSPGPAPTEEKRPAEVPEKTEALEAVEKEPPQKGEVQSPPPEETVSVAPKPLEVKRSLKKKSYNVSKVITKAIAKIEKEAEESRPRPILDAIQRLEKEVKGTGSGKSTGAATPRGGTGREGVELLDIYHAEIWHRIQKNWAFSEELAQGASNLEAVVIVKIMKDGKIRDIWFEKRSGNTYFDDSALKAVKKSDPLPPLPAGFSEPFYEVGFRFNPFELRGNP
jgi:colicin import membrane protein